jgi:hypothetical protein
MSDQSYPPTLRQPHPELRCLDRLVGTWILDGHEIGSDVEIHGQVTFEWLDGGFFLIRRVDLDYAGQQIKGLEVIGYEAIREAFTSHYFENTGNTFDYVWEVGDESLTVWTGYVGSSVFFRGTFSTDASAIHGCWEWPGGGYEETLTRVK